MNLCHPQAPAALLMAGQGGNLNRQGADILLVPYIEVVSCQVDGRSVVVGFPVIRRAKGDRAFLRFPGQVYLMGHSDIGVTMNTYTHLGLEDAVEEMSRVQEIENARKEQEKLAGKKEETKVSKKMFRAG